MPGTEKDPFRREYIATQAMQAIIQAKPGIYLMPDESGHPMIAARIAVQFADALMKVLDGEDK